MKKKLLSLALVMMLSVSMIACGGESDTIGEVNSVEEVVSDVEEEAGITTAPDYLPAEELESFIEEEIVLTTENVNDYFQVVKEVTEVEDAFGDPTGETNTSYYIKLNEGYYIYSDTFDTSDEVIIRWEWVNSSQTNEVADVSINRLGPNRATNIYATDDGVLEGTCTQVLGTIYKISIPEEQWHGVEDGMLIEVRAENGLCQTLWK